MTPTAATELEIKQAWWNIIINLANSKEYPLWKAAVWFEEMKVEGSYSRPDIEVTKDYRITFSSLIASPFAAALMAKGNGITYAGNVSVTCAGVLE